MKAVWKKGGLAYDAVPCDVSTAQRGGSICVRNMWHVQRENKAGLFDTVEFLKQFKIVKTEADDD